MDMIPVISASLSVGQLANEYAAKNAFVDYQEKLATNSLKRHEDDIKLFSVFLKQLGMKAGIFTQQEYALIKAVEGYSHKEGRNVDEKRRDRDAKTRIGDKKAE